VNASGLVTAVAAGSATIIAATSDGMLKATCQVTVVGNGDGISSATSGMDIQVQGSLILINGLGKGTEVSAYDTAGSLIGTTVATNGTATLDASLYGGSAIIVKIGERSIKISIR
jgi:uncharacterized protein YjdB